ncbi:MAG: SDR family NAD(P)-dependent oxidoreductase [Eubacterium sp.]
MGIKNYIKRGIKYIIYGVPNKEIKTDLYFLNPNERLKERVVLITGGGRGLGFCFAKKCISEGATVIICGRNIETLKKAEAELGEHCKSLAFDSAEAENFDRFIADAEKTVGKKIDSLICNAGISLHEGNFRNVSLEQFDSQMNINLKGTYFLCKSFVKYLESKDEISGNILIVSSERSKYCDTIPYGLTKSALNNFTQGLASDVASEGIRVNAIAPGVTASDMTGFSADGNLFAEWQATERIYLPEEVSETALFLLSDVSKCISGQIIVCDNGKYINRAY